VCGDNQARICRRSDNPILFESIVPFHRRVMIRNGSGSSRSSLVPTRTLHLLPHYVAWSVRCSINVAIGHAITEHHAEASVSVEPQIADILRG
jgi:hypothetical protein